MGPTRRSWLKQLVGLAVTGLGMTAGLLAGHGLQSRRTPGYPARPSNFQDRAVRLIRPPGAVEEKEFLAGCIRCYRCQDACEPGAIQFFAESDGPWYHTPYVDPSIKACNLCSHREDEQFRCTQVCPTGVLAPMLKSQRTEIDMGSVALDTDRCLSYKAKTIRNEQYLLMMTGQSPTESEAEVMRRGPCGECYMFCPRRERAIQLQPGAFLAPLIFVDHCIGCGLCEEICRQMVRGEPAIRVVATRGNAG